MKHFKTPGLLFFLACGFFVCGSVFSQEALKSAEEDYYDFLALQGLTGRPYLNYRTLSDSAWPLGEDTPHPWQNQNLGKRRGVFGGALIKIYGPELFTSVNTAAPYGQNDGALWQGRGFNAAFSGGLRFEGWGLELTFKPQLAFSQNLAFEIMPSAYSGTNYTDKAGDYGYYGVTSIDAPQRFGDKAFFAYDWGDSEVRYSWKTLTMGFGTQPVWLGPAQLNPILHSNNAAAYPKLDIGLRRQKISIKKFDFGDIETRAWWGYLTESAFYDNDSTNDHNLITGFSLAYSFPSFLRGFTIGINRIMLSKWQDIGLLPFFTLLWPFMSNDAGSDNNDQRASVFFDYLLPVIGLDVYFEWGRNDHSPNIDYVLRYPFHTAGYTVGIKKSITFNRYLSGEILLEATNLECSMDYDRLINWFSTFYAHHIIIQGHTNKGQWLGAGIGTGGNSQFLGFKLFFPRGYGQFFIQRRNPDLDYTWYIDSKKYPEEFNKGNWVAEGNIRLFLDFGLSGLYHITKNLSVFGSCVLRDERNPLNKSKSITDHSSVHRYNVYFSTMVKYAF